jgi:hypothetical protein
MKENSIIKIWLCEISCFNAFFAEYAYDLLVLVSAGIKKPAGEAGFQVGVLVQVKL